jgi:hypothetical protein
VPLALLALLAAAAVGCSSDGSPAPTSPTATATIAGTPGATATSGATGSGGSATPGAPAGAPAWASGPRSVTRTPAGQPRLVSVRTGHNDEGGVSYDRLVLEFTGGLPGYSAEYVSQVARPGEGSPVPLTGKAFFQIVLYPAAAHDDAGSATVRAPLGGGGLPVLSQVAIAGDFEGYVHIGVGLTGVVGYRVTELTGPSRLAVDFAA